MRVEKRISSFFFLVACLGLGIWLAGTIAVFFFSLIPSDFSRTERLLRFLRKECPPQSTLVFGNSVAMDGFNGKLFSQEACSPSCFNLSSPGQNQLESLLFITTLSKGPKRVFHFFHSIELKHQDYLPDRVIQNFMLFDYHPSPSLLSLLSMTGSAENAKVFQRNSFANAFDNRWLLTNYINTGFRRLLRRDLLLGNLVNELYYPRNYVAALPPDKKLALIRPSDLIGPQSFQLNPKKKEIMQQTAHYLHEQGIEYVVIFAPVNPALTSYGTAYLNGIKNMSDTLQIPHMTCINLSTLLNEEDFVDHIHPSESGANKITLELAKRFNSCSSKR